MLTLKKKCIFFNLCVEDEKIFPKANNLLHLKYSYGFVFFTTQFGLAPVRHFDLYF